MSIATEPRDLNRNGTIDIYEDPTAPIEDRIEDLLGQMTIPEKVGLMFHHMTLFNVPFPLPPSMDPAHFIVERQVNHSAFFGAGTAVELAEWHNGLQRLAESTRLGIPFTLSSDPRHGAGANPIGIAGSQAFSVWPDAIGLAAARDPELTRQFADIARQEYTAVGIRVSLHPQSDLATEPRWGRISGTFGEDVEVVCDLTEAYIRGFQGETIGPGSVSCMTKHFPGGGPQKDGEDPHFPYGREQVYPGGGFAIHLKPFEVAIRTGTGQMMPYYGMPVETEWEEVGFGFNKGIVTGLLREQLGFDGIVCTDWGLITDADIAGKPLPARAWGVEHLEPIERVAKAIDAGCDQLGGEICTDLLLALVEQGRVTEARLDLSARRILREKFRLGLFDQPYVDVDAAHRICGNEGFVQAGIAAQRRSLVLLKNEEIAGDPVLPAASDALLYIEGIDEDTAAGYGVVVNTPAEADLAIVRIGAPFEPRSELALEELFHAGSLAFDEATLAHLLEIAAAVPTVVAIELDRPAVIPELTAAVAGLIGVFGASDAVVLDLIFGNSSPTGKLPFELPSSMEAVLAQRSDLPADSKDPLFPLGFGLNYAMGS
ncbi:MAG: glycoside hydrolase family 3 N-terminal domain-containing protein [Thermomicrobiales bacterium]